MDTAIILPKPLQIPRSNLLVWRDLNSLFSYSHETQNRESFPQAYLRFDRIYQLLVPRRYFVLCIYAAAAK
jgi:hypothetical protein